MDQHPQQRKHLFGDTYQGYELPGGLYVPGARYAPDPRPIWDLQSKHLSPRTWSGLRVLDLAGNNGYHAIRALREGAEAAFLVEQSASAVTKAREVAEAWSAPLVATQADIEIFPWEDWGGVDVVFCHQVLYHLVEPIKLLRRIYDVLGPRGRLFTYTRIALNVHEKHWEWVPSADTMRRTLYYVGFEGVNLDGNAADVAAVESARSWTASGQRKVLVTARV